MRKSEDLLPGHERLSNLQRLHSVDGLVAKTHLQLLQAAVASDIESGKVIVVNATPADIEAAVQILARQYLTAVHALQIAAAKALGPEAVFVSSDTKLTRAAAEQGLSRRPAAGPLDPIPSSSR